MRLAIFSFYRDLKVKIRRIHEYKYINIHYIYLSYKELQLARTDKDLAVIEDSAVVLTFEQNHVKRFYSFNVAFI